MATGDYKHWAVIPGEGPPHALMGRVMGKEVCRGWALHFASWVSETDEKGVSTCDVMVRFGAPEEGAARASAADRLELIRMGLLPLDKLRAAR
jgi:hypothetical protein